MSIEKLAFLEKEDTPFEILSRETIQTIKNPDSLAIWTYLQSKPKNWNVNEKEIREHFGIGRDRYLKAMRYLRELGLYEYIFERDSFGRISRKIFKLYAAPKVRKTISTENPTLRKSDPINNKSNNKDIQNNKEYKNAEGVKADKQKTFFETSTSISEKDVFEKWNSFAKKENLPKCLKLTDARKKHIRARLKESEFDFDSILKEVSKSSFLTGKSSDWKVTFDWLIKNNTNYIKVLEGKYRDKPVNNPLPLGVGTFNTAMFG